MVLHLQHAQALPKRPDCFLGAVLAGKAHLPCSLQHGSRGVLQRLLGNVSPRVQLHTLACQTKGDDQSRDGENGGSNPFTGEELSASAPAGAQLFDPCVCGGCSPPSPYRPQSQHFFGKVDGVKPVSGFPPSHKALVSQVGLDSVMNCDQ